MRKIPEKRKGRRKNKKTKEGKVEGVIDNASLRICCLVREKEEIRPSHPHVENKKNCSIKD